MWNRDSSVSVVLLQASRLAFMCLHDPTSTKILNQCNNNKFADQRPKIPLPKIPGFIVMWHGNNFYICSSSLADNEKSLCRNASKRAQISDTSSGFPLPVFLHFPLIPSPFPSPLPTLTLPFFSFPFTSSPARRLPSPLFASLPSPPLRSQQKCQRMWLAEVLADVARGSVSGCGQQKCQRMWLAEVLVDVASRSVSGCGQQKSQAMWLAEVLADVASRRVTGSYRKLAEV